MAKYGGYCLFCGLDTNVMELPVQCSGYKGKFCDLKCWKNKIEEDKLKEKKDEL